eukprot:298902-Chlamydomonas_euryale.AAC.1
MGGLGLWKGLATAFLTTAVFAAAPRRCQLHDHRRCHRRCPVLVASALGGVIPRRASLAVECVALWEDDLGVHALVTVSLRHVPGPSPGVPPVQPPPPLPHRCCREH